MSQKCQFHVAEKVHFPDVTHCFALFTPLTTPQIPAHKFRSSAIVLRLENMGLFYKRDLC